MFLNIAKHGEITSKFQFTGTATELHQDRIFINLIMISTVNQELPVSSTVSSLRLKRFSFFAPKHLISWSFKIRTPQNLLNTILAFSSLFSCVLFFFSKQLILIPSKEEMWTFFSNNTANPRDWSKLIYCFGLRGQHCHISPFHPLREDNKIVMSCSLTVTGQYFCSVWGQLFFLYE